MQFWMLKNVVTKFEEMDTGAENGGGIVICIFVNTCRSTAGL